MQDEAGVLWQIGSTIWSIGAKKELSAAGKSYFNGCGLSDLSCITFVFGGLQGQSILAGAACSGGDFCAGESVPQEI